MEAKPLMEQLYSREHDEVILWLTDTTLLRGLSTLRWNLDELLTGRRPVLLVDISGLQRLSSPTLAALLRAQRVCRGRGGGVVLRGANNRCLDVLTGTGLLDLFGIADARTRSSVVRLEDRPHRLALAGAPKQAT